MTVEVRYIVEDVEAAVAFYPANLDFEVLFETPSLRIRKLAPADLEDMLSVYMADGTTRQLSEREQEAGLRADNAGALGCLAAPLGFYCTFTQDCQDAS
ncbi:MAG: hypothetical protein R3E82_06955 [Pseudomonadales bacterium]|nr:hypothetical protein [Pseudomonadales bacterium]